MLDGSAVYVGDPRGGAEVVGVVEVERGGCVRVVGQRVEVAEHRRRGGERVCGEGLCSVLELYVGQRVACHTGIHHGEAVFAQLGGDTLALGIIVLGVALRVCLLQTMRNFVRKEGLYGIHFYIYYRDILCQ